MHTHTHALSHTHTLSLSHTHTHKHSLTHTPRTHARTHARTHTHTLSLTHTHTEAVHEPSLWRGPRGRSAVAEVGLQGGQDLSQARRLQRVQTCHTDGAGARGPRGRGGWGRGGRRERGPCGGRGQREPLLLMMMRTPLLLRFTLYKTQTHAQNQTQRRQLSSAVRAEEWNYKLLIFWVWSQSIRNSVPWSALKHAALFQNKST